MIDLIFVGFSLILWYLFLFETGFSGVESAVPAVLHHIAHSGRQVSATQRGAGAQQASTQVRAIFSFGLFMIW